MTARTIWQHLVLLLTLTLLHTGLAIAQTPEPQNADDLALEAYVDGLIATYRAIHDSPGYTVSVVRPDRTVFAKGYGYADLEAVTLVDPDATRFYIASISKTFVWTLAMIYVERGELDLDRDVNDYLTRYTVPDGERPLTLNDLMAHRGGFEESLDVFVPEIAALPLPEAMAASEPAQAFPRGDRAAYSNWGSNLVALVLEDATGKSYETLLYEELLGPLGMTATTLTENSPNANDPDTYISKNYTVGGSGPEEVGQLDLGAFAPIGGMTTTASDMAPWMRFHLNRGELDGTRLMSDATYALMLERKFNPVPGSGGRAHGFSDRPYRNTRFFGHTGSINAFFSHFAFSPELGLGVFISQNTSDSFDPLAGVPTLVFDRELRLRGADDFGKRAAPAAEDTAFAEQIAGDYITSRRAVTGFEKMFSLLDGAISISADEGRLSVSGSDAPYTRIADNLWENRLGLRLAVVRGDNDEVIRLIGSSGATDLTPVTFLTNPNTALMAIGATAFFAVTTWLGFWRRVGQQREKTGVGGGLTVLALLGIAPLIWMGALAASMGDTYAMSFAEIFADWPPPLIGDFTLAATVAAAMGVLLFIGVLPAWASSGWSLWRKGHYSLFASCYLAMGILFVMWGVAPRVM
ncbi:MAG: serine hydrolase domain-containing protein [Pseudomonadota bacterium]